MLYRIEVLNEVGKTLLRALARAGVPHVCPREVMFHHWNDREYDVYPLRDKISDTSRREKPFEACSTVPCRRLNATSADVFPLYCLQSVDRCFVEET